mgnify:CR=1 FL=1
MAPALGLPRRGARAALACAQRRSPCASSRRASPTCRTGPRPPLRKPPPPPVRPGRHSWQRRSFPRNRHSACRAKPMHRDSATCAERRSRRSARSDPAQCRHRLLLEAKDRRSAASSASVPASTGSPGGHPPPASLGRDIEHRDHRSGRRRRTQGTCQSRTTGGGRGSRPALNRRDHCAGQSGSRAVLRGRACSRLRQARHAARHRCGTARVRRRRATAATRAPPHLLSYRWRRHVHRASPARRPWHRDSLLTVVEAAHRHPDQHGQP